MVRSSSPATLGRVVYFLCTVLQVPIFPVYPLTSEGIADFNMAPEYASSLQVVLATLGPKLGSNLELLSLAVLPGAAVRELCNWIFCKVGVRWCKYSPVFNWSDPSTLADQPPFAASYLGPRLSATYSENLVQLFAGCFVTIGASVICIYTSTKLSLLGIGVSVHAVLKQSCKLAPWVGIPVSSAVLASELLELRKLADDASGGEPAGVDNSEEETKKGK
mmetsp:Transcript_27933/g.66346  ORF Transcript_27933/g.66346 Transcript_27933/m.66346 type:complete len:220 (-) Transcript_27933:388-1047(-)